MTDVQDAGISDCVLNSDHRRGAGSSMESASACRRQMAAGRGLSEDKTRGCFYHQPLTP